MLEKTLNLELFRNAEEGFMIVLEEEGTDNFGNSNNAAGVLEAVLRADAAIGVAMDFVDKINPNTLVVTAADSDAGGLEILDVNQQTTGTISVQPSLIDSPVNFEGMAIPLDGKTGNNTQPFLSAPDANGNTFKFGVGFVGTPDFAGSIVAKAYGVNAEQLPATVDNTDIYRLMYQTLFDIQPERAKMSNAPTLSHNSQGNEPTVLISASGARVSQDRIITNMINFVGSLLLILLCLWAWKRFD